MGTYNAGNITCWVAAGDIGLTGSEQAAEIENNDAVMSTFFEIRARALRNLYPIVKPGVIPGGGSGIF